MRLHGLGPLEDLSYFIIWVGDSYCQIKARVTWLRANLHDVSLKFSWAFEHGTTPFSNVWLSSWVKEGKHSPAHAFDALFKIWVKLSHLNNQVARRFNTTVRVLCFEVNFDNVRVGRVRSNVLHLDQTRLWVRKNLAVALKAETKLAVTHVQRRLENCVKVDIKRSVLRY